MKKLLLVLMIMLMALSFTVACDGDNGGSSSDKLKVALILPGKKDDLSFNQSMYEGMMNYLDANEDKMELKVTENVYEVSDIEPALLDFADQGYDVIIGHGFQFMEPLVKVAKQYPDTHFVLGTGYKFEKNSAIYDVSLDDGGYQMGVIAGLATQTNKVGVIGGADVSEIYRGHEGFKLGAKSVNPNIQIQEVYTGDWNDTAGAKEAAVGMYDSGVDVIWHSGDGIGLGVVQAAKEKDKYVLGNVADQLKLAEKNVLSGVVYQWKAVLENIFDDIDSGEFLKLADEERFYWITAENEGLNYSKINDSKGWLTSDDLTKIESSWKDLKAGKIDFSVIKEPTK
ncbi:MAG: nucleoside-binding protein [Fusobacteria bacterium]|nr:MAG: nucleoside-binding protein [Fusobacteriota bacterium]KAF0229050.1 MAG: nucleoside-binding [Fusobacteriota bacterium]